ncbi:NUDIX domain-containing protein [Corynebacterium sp. HS2168-gen11]|uniref:NUDIX hydrolase n=1 Tax=Corynebacterium sp. HS2168-gen11 TaxID=2974027 RepID=UPI00216B4413|nr:NUDIX domain-containing protein [Corynebacterium sp. HS2168-gen11]MCS4535450.1 NUDIX domain-containing protein [Corynebacterium sp. HS2168-gen11]
MATPEFIVQLRTKIGHDQLWLPGVVAIVLKDVPPGAPITAVPEVLLVKRKDSQQWTPITGLCEPGEQPHLSAIREVQEEVGVSVTVDALLGVGATEPMVHANGDRTVQMETAVRCSVQSGTPHVADSEEISDVRWFSVMQVPAMAPRFRLMIGDAVAQLRHPAGFQPRMGFEKRTRMQRS